MRFRLFVLLLPFVFAVPGWAAETPEVTLLFLGDRFEPAEVPVPANVKVALKIENRSAASVEWESTSLHREKVVPAGGKATVFVGPMKPGSYEFYDDFHPTIRGKLVAR